MRPIAIVLVLFACVTAAIPARAGQLTVCKEAESALGCAARLNEKIRGVKPATSGDPVKEADVAPKTETGLSDLPNGLSSSTKDFLPLLQLSGVLGPVVSDEKTGVVTVALNPRTGANFRNFQLRALVNSKPTLFKPLKDALDETALKKLQADFDKGKNRQEVTIETNFNLNGYRSSRNLAAYQTLVDQFFELATRDISSRSNAATQAALIAMDDLLEGTGSSVNDAFEKIPATKRAALEALAIQWATANAAGEKAVDSAMKDSGLMLLAQMVNNQPQRVATVSYVSRDPLVGPNKVIVGRFAYERADGADLNSFLKDHGRYSGCVAKKNIESCFEDFRAYIAEEGRQEKIKAGLRFSAYVEFTTRTEDYVPYRDGATAPLVDIKKGTIATAGADFGRLLDVEEDGKAGGRVDGSLRWDYDRNAADRHRVVASLTVTKKLGDVSVPIGLVYATKGPAPGTYDYGLSAHVGLKFNLFKGLK